MNTISNGELSDPLCDSVNRGLTLVRLRFVNISILSNADQYMQQDLYCNPDLLVKSGLFLNITELFLY